MLSRPDEPSTPQVPRPAPSLEVAVGAIKAGDRAMGRELLLRVVDAEPANEIAWIWLASVAADPQETLRALRAARDLTPGRARTVASLRKLLFREGTVAAQAGDRERAHRLLEECAQLDPDNARVWLWLASTAATPRDAIGHLRRTLQIDPTHELARTTLDRILRREDLVSPIDAAAVEAAALAEARAEADAEAAAEAAAHASASTDADGRPGEGREAAARTVDWPAADRLDRVSEFRSAVPGSRLDGATESRPAVTQVRPRASVRTAILPGFDSLTGSIGVRGEIEANDDSRLVMVVDDSPAIQERVATTLGRAGHRVLAARNGRDAFDQLARIEPDLILLDVTTEDVDGYQLCRALRSRQTSRGVPVVLSGKDSLMDRVRGWMAGATDSIAKPFAETALLNVVDRYAAARN
jgi:CheY-like chemotaxis protein